VIDGVQVSKRKWREPKEKLGLKQKRMQVEVESDGSGEEGWRAWGLQDITFGLLGLKEIDKERNELWREQHSYLHRIARLFESGLGPEEIEVLVEDSIIRE